MKLDSTVTTSTGIQQDAMAPGTQVRRHRPVENAFSNIAAWLLSIIGAGLLGLLCGLVFCGVVRLEVRHALWPVIPFMLVMVWWWFRSRRLDNGERGARRLESLLWTAEEASRTDLPAMQQTAPELHQWAMYPDRNKILYGHFAEEIEVIREWARAALSGNSLAINTWRKRFTDYAEFRRSMINRATPLLRDYGREGVELTEDGILWCYQILGTAPDELVDGVPLPGGRPQLEPPTRGYTRPHTVGGSE